MILHFYNHISPESHTWHLPHIDRLKFTQDEIIAPDGKTIAWIENEQYTFFTDDDLSQLSFDAVEVYTEEA